MNELTEFQIAWCVVMSIALSVAFMDVYQWRATPEICDRTYHVGR